MTGQSNRNQPEKDKASSENALSAIHNLAGQTINAALAAVTGFDAKSLVEKLPLQRVASYMRGKKLDATDANLNKQERADLQVYKELHDSLTAKIPFYDHDAFVSSMENEMHVKASTDATLGAISSANPASSGSDARSGTGLESGAGSDAASGARSDDKSLAASGARSDDRSRPPSGAPSDDKSHGQSGDQHGTESSATGASKFLVPGSLADGFVGETLSSGKSRAAQTGNFDAINTKNKSSDKPIAPDFGSDRSAPITWSSIVENPLSPGKTDHSNTNHSDSISRGYTAETSTASPLGFKSINISGSGNAESGLSQAAGKKISESRHTVNADQNSGSNFGFRSAQNRQSDHTSSVGDNTQSGQGRSFNQSAQTEHELNANEDNKPNRGLSANRNTRSDPGLNANQSTSSKDGLSPNQSNTVSYGLNPYRRTMSDCTSDSNRSIRSDHVPDGNRCTTSDHRSDTNRSTTSDEIKDANRRTTSDQRSDTNQGTTSTHGVNANQSTMSLDVGRRAQSEHELNGTHANVTDGVNSRSAQLDVRGASVPKELMDQRSTRASGTTSIQVSASEQLAKFEHLLNSNGINCIRWQTDFRSSTESQSCKFKSAPQAPIFVHRSEIIRTDLQTTRTGHMSGIDHKDASGHRSEIDQKNAPDHSAAINRRNATDQNTRYDTKTNPHSNDRATTVQGTANHGAQLDGKESRAGVRPQTDPEGMSQQSIINSKSEALSARGQKTRFDAGEKRFILGSEIALAVIVAAAGATRIRASGSKGPRAELIPGGEGTKSIGQTIYSTNEFDGADTNPLAESSHTLKADRLDSKNSSELQTHTDRSNSTIQESDAAVSRSSDSPVTKVSDSSLSKNSDSSLTKISDAPLTKNLVSDSQKRTNKAKPPTIRPKTLIASTDTLTSIAEAFFYDRNIAWLIADLNQNHLKESWMDEKRIVELKTRQLIELPLWSDIEEFYRTRPEHAKPENLITIVEQTSIDAELLNSSLKRLVSD